MLLMLKVATFSKSLSVLSAASYPPFHKTQGRGTHYVDDVGAIKKPGHPASKWVLCGYSGLRVFLLRTSIHDSEEMVGEQDDL
jgi:hypothetical protein